MPSSRSRSLPEFNPDLRKEVRVPVQLNMHLEGVSDRGIRLDVPIVTENVSRSGLCFRTGKPMPVQPGDRIDGTLENVRLQARIALQVKWKEADRIGAQLHVFSEQWLIR